MAQSELDRQVLDGFSKLSEERKKVFLDFMRLLVHFPGFGEALQERTPPGADCPPWEAVEALVTEWMAKQT